MGDFLATEGTENTEGRERGLAGGSGEGWGKDGRPRSESLEKEAVAK